MKLLLIGLLALVGHVLAEKISYKDYKVYKIIPKNEDALKALKDLEDRSSELSRFQFWSGPTKVGHEVNLMVAPELKENIEAMLDSIDVEKRIMIDDVQEKIDAENPLRKKIGVNAVDWSTYNTLDEINDWLESLKAEFPTEIDILRPGKSHQGRDIVGVKLDFRPTVPKPAVFIESNIHAREWITAATTTYILDQLLRPSNSDITTLSLKYTWYIFPVMNPDGYVYTHEGDRMWRKTRTRYNIFCYGADPNRNWGFEWMNGGASSNPCSDIYGGPRAFSEPSVEVMRDFITTIGPNLLAYLNFHSYSQMLLLPYGHTTAHLDNYDEMMGIGETALDALRAVHGTNYTIGTIAETIYIASGSSMDWVKGTFNTSIAYTYELRDKGESGFLLPAAQIIPTAEETLVSIVSIFQEYEKLHPTIN